MGTASREVVKVAMLAMIADKEGLGKDEIPNLDPLRTKVKGDVSKELRDEVMAEIKAETKTTSSPEGDKKPSKKDVLATKKGQLKKLEEVNVKLEAEEDEKGLIDISVATKRQKRRGTIKGLKAEIKTLEKGK